MSRSAMSNNLLMKLSPGTVFFIREPIDGDTRYTYWKKLPGEAHTRPDLWEPVLLLGFVQFREGDVLEHQRKVYALGSDLPSGMHPKQPVRISTLLANDVKEMLESDSSLAAGL